MLNKKFRNQYNVALVTGQVFLYRNVYIGILFHFENPYFHITAQPFFVPDSMMVSK
jgi:hypothetical protein